MQNNVLPKLRLVWRILINGLATGLIISILLLTKSPANLKAQVYDWARETMKKSMEIRTYNWHTLEGEHFRVKYQPVDAPIARLVLETAEDSFHQVNEMLGYKPKNTVPIFIYPNRVSLNKSFGWDGSVDAMGVYWAGAIRILSPLEWAGKEEELVSAFKEKGPMAHEYAHLLIDYRTHGNYPRWLTEGIAQYIEKKLTGYTLSKTDDKEDTWYSFSKMDEQFDLLSNQDLAYRQSLLAIEYIVEIAGFDSILEILDELGKGLKINTALENIIGKNLTEFEESFSLFTN